MYRTKRFWIGLAIIVITFFLAFRGIQVGQVVNAAERLDPRFLLLGIVAFWLSYGGRAFRWQLLFTPYKLRLGKVLSTLNIGYFLSNITPLRLGDVVRAYLLANIEHVPTARALSSVVVERISDALTIVLILVLLTPFITNIPAELRSAAGLGGSVGVVMVLAFAILSLQRERAVGLLKRLTARMSFLQRDSVWRALENVIDGFAVLHAARPLFGVIAWSLVIWFVSAIQNWIFMFAIGIHLGFDAALLTIVATSLAVTVAPTPGQLGVFHAATVFALVTVYHVPQADALAYAFLIHAWVYLWLMVLGILSMWREGLSYGKLQAVESRVEAINPS